MFLFGSKFAFFSGFAVQAGLKPKWKELRGEKAQQRRVESMRRHDPRFRRLSERQRKELLEAIRNDDWFE